MALMLPVSMPVSAAIVLDARSPADCELPDGDIDGDECLTQNTVTNLGGASADCTGQPDCVGNPINVATGSKYENEVDYRSSDSNPVILSRYYNSADTQFPSPLGTGWRNSYSRVIAITNNAIIVNAIRDDGKTLSFTLTNGVWQPAGDVNSKLVKLASGWQYTTGLDDVETYNANGNLVSITNRAGLVQTLTYDSQGRLSTVSNQFGRSLGFAYTGAGTLIASVTVPNGGAYKYTYDSNNNLVTVTYPDNTKRQFVYENTAYPHALTGVIDEKGNRFATFAYNSGGLATSTEHAGGVEKNTLDYTNVTNGYVAVTNALGAITTSTFTSINGVALESQNTYKCLNCSTVTGTNSTSYDANGNITSYIDYNGNKTTYTYDLTRNLEISRTEAAGTAQVRTIKTTWNASFRLPVKIVEPLRTTTFSYDAKGNLLTKTITDGKLTRSWTMTYNSNGQPLTIDGPRTDVADITTFAYDAQGNLSTITNALGQVSRITSYNADGKPLSVQDPNGLVTTLAYDARGKLVTSTAGTEKTSYSYDPAQLLTTLTLANGATYTNSYDAAQRLTRTTDAFGNHIDYKLDAMGNRLGQTVSDSANNVTRSHTNSFDALSHLAKSIGAQGQTTALQYDANGNIVGVTDPLKNVQSKAYDALNRLTQATDPNNGKTSYSYDANNAILQITDPLGLHTQYTRDGLGDLLTLTSPDTGVSQKTYDAAGNVLTSTDARGKVTKYSYDALNRLIAINRNDGGVITYSYDSEPNSIGHLVKMVDDTDTTHWSYDSHGRVIAKAQIYAGEQLSNITYSYDKTGNLTQMTYPSGYIIGYNYDKGGRLVQVNVNSTPVVSNITYTPFGGIAAMNYINGTTYNRQYDSDGRISKYTALGTRNIELTYDAASRIIQYTDSDNVVNQAMGYDALGRILSANGYFGNEAYTYDANGNRLTHAINGETGAYQYDTASNHLLSTTITNPILNTSLQLGYDAAGNTISANANPLTYNDMGRLESVAGTKYIYNGFGQRIYKYNTNSFVSYDEAGHQIGEYIYHGSVVNETLYVGDMPVAIGTASGAYFINPDHLNAPRVITDSNGGFVSFWDFTPFGERGQITGGQGLTYNARFPGQYHDSETGLNNNGYRDYSPSLGRYIQSDPIGLGGGINTYGYVGGNPVIGVDQIGLDTLVIINGSTFSFSTSYPYFRGNPFGHAAIATTGSGVYSYGNNGTGNYLGSNLMDYLTDQAQRRDSYIFDIPTNSAQEKNILDYLNSHTSKVNVYPDNCAARVEKALMAGGVTLSDPFALGLPPSSLPASLERSLVNLVDQGGATGQFIPQYGVVPQNLNSFNVH